MIINNIQFFVELEDILVELQSQLEINHIQLLQKTKPSKDDIMIQCPYHGNGQEKKPSAGIRKTDGIFHCFACGEVHTLQEVISHCFGHYDDMIGSFGWNWLLKNFLTVSVEERKPLDLDLVRPNTKGARSIEVPKWDSSKVVPYPYVKESELDSYRYIHPYMYERKLTDEVIELFDIGYDKNSDCITFPVRDIRGNTVFIARRSTKTKFFNYPNGAEKPVYGLYEITNMTTQEFKEFFPSEFTGNELIICESMIDALTCWIYGKPAVALNGLGNDLQFKQLQLMPFRKFILATDNDEAGMKARDRLRRNIKNKIITEYILPEGKKDINELNQQEFNNLEEVF